MCVITVYVQEVLMCLCVFGLQKPSGGKCEEEDKVTLPLEKFGKRFLIKCHQLRLGLTIERNGAPSHVSVV